MFLFFIPQILEQTSGSRLAEELKIIEMCEKFFMELSKSSKHTATGIHSSQHVALIFFCFLSILIKGKTASFR